MAKVEVLIAGGSKRREFEVDTVADVKRILKKESFTATVQGEPKQDSHTLSDGDLVILSESIKGA